MTASKEIICRDISLERTGETLSFGNAHLTLRFDPETGALLSMEGEKPRTYASPGKLEFHLGGKTRHFRWDSSTGSYSPGEKSAYVTGTESVGSAAALEDATCEISDGHATLTLHLREGDYEIEDRYTLWPGEPVFVREASILSRAAREEKLRHLDLGLPAVLTDENDAFEAPGFTLATHTPVHALPDGRWTDNVRRTSGNDGLIFFSSDQCNICFGLSSAAGGSHLLATAYSREELVLTDTERRGDAVALLHTFLCASRLRPGQRVSAGRQVVCLHDGAYEDALSVLGDIHSKLDVRVPPDTPEWMKRLAIYEAHVGPKFMDPFFPEEQGYEPYSTLGDLETDLERIKDLGFDVLQLMPHFPYPGYTVHDYMDVDVHYGGKEALISLVERAHALGMRVILDVILHGPVDKSRERYARWASERSFYLDEHPEWFMRTESGEIAASFTYAFDVANRDWQDHFIGVMRYYVEEIGVDGFRVDAPTWNNFPNWDPLIPYKAGTSAVGCLSLFRRAREEFSDLDKEVVLFTEPGGPALHEVFDITYSYDEMWLLAALVTPIVEAYGEHEVPVRQKITVRGMRDWLRHKQLAYPDGAFERVVRQIDSHDSFEWNGLGQFRREAFGIEAARALFATNALLPGGIMSFVGGEEGSERFYREVLALRRRPEFAEGVADFGASSCEDNMIWHLVHRRDDHAMLVLVNFATTRTAARIELAKYINYRDPVVLLGSTSSSIEYDSVRESGSVQCELGPYEVLVLGL